MRVLLIISSYLGAVAGARDSAGQRSPLIFWSRSKGTFGDERAPAGLDTVARVNAWMDSRFRGPHAPELLVVIPGGSASHGLDQSPNLRSEISASASSAVLAFAPPISWARWGAEQRASSWEAAREIVAARGRAGEKTAEGPTVLLLDGSLASEAEARFGGLLAEADEATGGKFAVALAMEETQPAQPEYVAAMTSPIRRLDDGSTTDAIGYVRMTPDLLAGILTGLLLVIIAMIGLSCLSSIQTPSQFTDKPPPSTREVR